jgi:hypothetical protein
MPSSFSPSLRIELIAPGEQAGTWNTTTNTNLGTLLEGAIAGVQAVSITTANQALTIADGSADQSRVAVLQFSTTTTAAFSVYAPPVSKQYTIYNASAYAATIFNSTAAGNTTAAGTGITIPAGRTMTVWTNGTNFRVQNDHLIGNLVGNVTGNLTGNVTGSVTGNVTGNLTGNVTGNLTGAVTGNASTATALQTARAIGGVSFDGTANINLPGVNSPGNQNTTGSAASVSGTTTAAVQSSALATGTADSTTFLRGDRTWQTISTIPTTEQVLNATAGATAGAVGTYAFMRYVASGNIIINIGGTTAGSNLRYVTIAVASSESGQFIEPRQSATVPSGTWRVMGYMEQNTSTANVNGPMTVCLRIS